MTASESRLALLAAAARDVGATVYHVRPKHARDGAHLRLRIGDRGDAETLNQAAQSLGFYTGGVLHEDSVSCQLVVVVPAGDLVGLRRTIGGVDVALPAHVGELTP